MIILMDLNTGLTYLYLVDLYFEAGLSIFYVLHSLFSVK